MLIVQASNVIKKRLKGKTLLKMKGKPLLVERSIKQLVSLSKKIKKIVIATSNKKSDN